MRRTKTWQPVWFAVGNLLAVGLLASWLFEPTRFLWLRLDDTVFWLLNDSLVSGRAWQVFWAASNNRAFDLLSALSVIALFAYRALMRDRENLESYIAIGAVLTVTVVAARQFAVMIPIQRLSPTFVYLTAFRLSELVPEFHVKDKSPDCFPGDHGLILLICAGFFAFYLPRIYAILASAMAVVFVLPRLMSGAHWLSDEIVGAVAVAVFVLTWMFTTPLHHHLTSAVESSIRRTRRVLRQKNSDIR